MSLKTTLKPIFDLTLLYYCQVSSCDTLLFLFEPPTWAAL